MEHMKIRALFLSIILAQLAGVIGSLFTAASVRDWYDVLILPSFAPPSWVFGPVWIILYTSMGIAAYLIWIQKKNHESRRALSVYGIHLVLNTLWSILFFGLRSPGLAFVEILILLGFIMYTTILFWKIDTRAGWLMVPYIAWVSFASVLNGAIYFLNYS